MAGPRWRGEVHQITMRRRTGPLTLPVSAGGRVAVEAAMVNLRASFSRTDRGAASKRVCVCVCVSAKESICLYLCLSGYTHLPLCMCLHLYVCLSFCMSVCLWCLSISFCPHSLSSSIYSSNSICLCPHSLFYIPKFNL